MNFKEYNEVKIEDAVDCIGASIEEARLHGIVNPMLFKVFLTVNYILLFSDIQVSEDDLQDKLALYNRFNAEGAIEKARNSEGFHFISAEATEWVEAIQKHTDSFAGVLEALSEFAEILGVNVAESAEKLSKIDLSNLPQLLKLAENLGAE